MKKLICIGGPTASGKTNVGIELAKFLSTEVVSFDSRQVYRELKIGVNRPSEQELNVVQHHLIGHKSISEPSNARIFEHDALACLEEIFENNDFAVGVGGTGLYFQVVEQGLDDIPNISDTSIQWVEDLFQNKGLLALQDYVNEFDPVYFNQVDQANFTRLMRAAQVIKETGMPFSHFRKRITVQRPFEIEKFYIDADRQWLYDRINNRVDQMIEIGLIEEATGLYPFRELKALQTVGYQEIFSYLEGKMSLDDAILKIKQNTRNYAKRQYTWFRRNGLWKPLEVMSVDKILSKIKTMI